MIQLVNAQELPKLSAWAILKLRVCAAMIRWLAGGRPLIYTARGMEPVDGLERVVTWQVSPGEEVVCIESWRCRITGQEVVRSPDVLSLKVPPPMTTAQASFG